MDELGHTGNILETSFGERFIEDYLGAKMSSDPVTAIVK